MLTADLIFGTTAAMAGVRRRCERAAANTRPFLIRGESGTGKTALAKFIHQLSGRSNAAFVAVSAFGISESLTQSALGGHRRGAFTGATESQAGLLVAANKGTLFLDEIGDASAQLQGLLLEFLDHGTARQVGDVRSAPVDVRLIGATNAPLEDRIAGARFRQDLLYRFGYSCVELIPLRKRRGDIPQLARHFVRHCTDTDALGRCFTLSTDALAMLSAAPWPDNIRGLKNAIEFGADSSEDGIIDVAQLPEELAIPEPSGGAITLEARLEKARHCLMRAGGNVTEAARAYGVTRQHFYRIIRPIRPGPAQLAAQA